MVWNNDKAKRFQRYAATLQEKRLARMERLVRTLGIVVVLGLVAIIIDVSTRSSEPKFFVDEPDVGYWVSGSGQNLQVYACGWGSDAPKGEDGKTPVAVLITKNGSQPIRVLQLN